MSPEQINEIIGMLAPKISEDLTKRLGAEFAPLIQMLTSQQQAGGSANGPVEVKRFDPDSERDVMTRTTRPQLMAEQIDAMYELIGSVQDLSEQFREMIEIAGQQQNGRSSKRKRKVRADDDE